MIAYQLIRKVYTTTMDVGHISLHASATQQQNATVSMKRPFNSSEFVPFFILSSFILSNLCLISASISWTLAGSTSLIIGWLCSIAVSRVMVKCTGSSTGCEERSRVCRPVFTAMASAILVIPSVVVLFHDRVSSCRVLFIVLLLHHQI